LSFGALERWSVQLERLGVGARVGLCEKKMMRWAAGVLCVVLSLATCDGSISVSRTVTELEMANVDVELDGCVQKDKYGCSAFNTDFGKNISGTVSAQLTHDLGEGSHFVVNMKVKTGLFPLPFELKCKLCGAKCGFEIPIVKKEIEIDMPPCPM